MCSVLTPQVQNIFHCEPELVPLSPRESIQNYSRLECPFPVEPILEGTVWDIAGRAVLTLCFAQLPKRLTTVTMLRSIRCLSFLQISKMIITKKLCRHFAKLTGGQGPPGTINRQKMFCICIGCFFTRQALEVLSGNLIILWQGNARRRQEEYFLFFFCFYREQTLLSHSRDMI